MHTANNNTPSTPPKLGYEYAGLFMVIALFDIVSWGLFGGAVHIVLDEYAEYEAIASYWIEHGCNSSHYVPNCNNPPYEPNPGMSFVLIVTLLPLIFDTVLLPVAFAFALRHRLHPASLLCEAVFAFAIWGGCGIYDALVSYSMEENKPNPFQSIWPAVAAFQIIIAVVWLMLMIAAAGSVHRYNKAKWMGRGAGTVAEEIHMQNLRRVESETTIAV